MKLHDGGSKGNRKVNEVLSALYDQFQQANDITTKYAILRFMHEALIGNQNYNSNNVSEQVELIVRHIGWSDCDTLTDFEVLNFLASHGISKRHRDTFISDELLNSQNWQKHFLRSPAVARGLCAWMSYDYEFKCIEGFDNIQMNQNIKDEEKFKDSYVGENTVSNALTESECSQITHVVMQVDQKTFQALEQEPCLISIVGNAELYTELEFKDLKNVVVLSLKNCKCLNFSVSYNLEQLMLENVIGFETSFLDSKQNLACVLLDDVQITMSTDNIQQDQLWVSAINTIFEQCTKLTYFNLSKVILPEEITLNINAQLKVLILYLNKNLRNIIITVLNSEAVQLELIDVYNYENYRFGYNIVELNINQNASIPNLSFVNCANIETIQERYGLLNVTKHFLA